MYVWGLTYSVVLNGVGGYYGEVMCQLDWATRCPETWTDIILGVSVRLCSD